MRLRLFLSRLTMLIMRSGWFLKIGITSSLLILIYLVWYFGLQQGLNHAQSKLFLEINDLKQQKELFDDLLIEYKTLYQKLNLHQDSKKYQAPMFNYYKIIVDQAANANLNLRSYTFKKIKDNFKQMMFNFVSDYDDLLQFLYNLDQVGAAINCQKLKIIKGTHRLQIAYVCGIHTFVK